MLRKEKENASVSSICLDKKPQYAVEAITKPYSMVQHSIVSKV